MCGLVGVVGGRDLVPVLLDGLGRLEYRGYDSAGLAVFGERGDLQVRRTVGPVGELTKSVSEAHWAGSTGLAHTRWATHGKPSEENAHPQVSQGRVAVVHNGIVENYQSLRQRLEAKGFRFTSETDTEVIAHNITYHLSMAGGLMEAVRRAVAELEGSYAIAAICRGQPERVVVARRGSPMLIGVGEGENLVASDLAALLPVTERFIALEEGDVAEVTSHAVDIVDARGDPALRPLQHSSVAQEAIDKRGYRHFMLKEIYEQPQALEAALEDRLENGNVAAPLMAADEAKLLTTTRHVHIVACGTSYHAGLAARNAFESLTGCPCTVELASEFRYRRPAVPRGTLFVTLSQSGETADTLAALRYAREHRYLASATICNVAHSSLVRESDYALLMRAGPEIGVASTKAFTVQLACLYLLALRIAHVKGREQALQALWVRELQDAPAMVRDALASDQIIRDIAPSLVEARHALFIGRGALFPMALEGALKLKEISYIHAEGYAGGELKHGPLALVDPDMPVIGLVADDPLREKMLSNLQEVQARGGRIVLMNEARSPRHVGAVRAAVSVPVSGELIRPIVYAVPLQLLAYHVALLRGNDVDKPRNLAKSVTVE
ncbi:MAG TPA: glutamine--fructose-6-phosphate transaminase (isomerizing) [Gammaproteobacteria bacterium]|nr:glutamine--fructose-6-phosphate transaminase (isomerizing) [Gammaproteobacteria bacterium]